MCSAVEKPGVKMSSAARAASTAAASPDSMRPRSTALRATRAGSTPRPSSRTSITTPPPAWRAATVRRPRGGLPAATRSSGGSRPWSSALRTRCTSGSPIASTTRAVQLGLLADELEVDLLVQARREVADEPREAQQHGLDRDHPDAHDELLQRVRAAGQLRHRLPEPGHAGLRDERLDVGALDDELAHGVQEVVESRGGDADAKLACRRLRLRGRCVAGRHIDGLRGSAIVAPATSGTARRAASSASGSSVRTQTSIVRPAKPSIASASGSERSSVPCSAASPSTMNARTAGISRVLGQADDDVHGAGGRLLAHERTQAGGERRRIEALAVAGLDAVDGQLERVDARHEHVDGVAVEAVAPPAEQLEDVLHRVRELRDGVVAHRRAHALERVGDAEDLVDRRLVVRPLLDAHDGEPEPLEVLARLGDEHRQVLGDVHQPSRR